MDCGAAWTRPVLAIANAVKAIADIIPTLHIVLSFSALIFVPPHALHFKLP
jgi:hypothetical protein